MKHIVLVALFLVSGCASMRDIRAGEGAISGELISALQTAIVRETISEYLDGGGTPESRPKETRQ